MPGSNKKLSDEQINQLTKPANQSIGFVENKGQWPAHILYRADVPGGQMLATTEGMLVAVFDPASVKAMGEYDMKMEALHMPNKLLQKKAADPGPAPVIKGFGWKLIFTGGKKATSESIINEGESQDYTNYLVGNPSTWANHVHSYTALTYKDLYKGISVKYYTSSNGSLENDIIVNPGADAHQVNMQIEGIDELNMDKNGGLILPTTLGKMAIASPVSYLRDAAGNRKAITLKYRLTGKNTLTFDIPDYDNSQTLVIDPIVMRWATWIASSSDIDSHCHGVDLDAEGNVYVVARGGNDFIATPGSFQFGYGGDTLNATDNLWISKYQEPVVPGGSGVRLWSTYLGGKGTTNPLACTVGPDGYLYIAGLTSDDLFQTYGTGAPAPQWTQRTISGGISSGYVQSFIAKIDPAGQWATVREIGSQGRPLNSEIYDIKIIPNGPDAFDLVACGYVNEQRNEIANGDIPGPQTPDGSPVLIFGESSDGYVFRITSDLNNIVWTKQFATNSPSNAFTMSTLDNAGNILLGGYTDASGSIAYNNSTQNSLSGGVDGWLMSLNQNSGNVNWSRYFNSAPGAITEILCMEVNQQKSQLVIGGTTSGLSDANLSAGAFNTSYPGSPNKNFFVASLPVNGGPTTWGTYFGGNGDNGSDNMMGLNVDENNDVYVLGYTNSKFSPATIPPTDNPVQDSSYDPINYDAIFFKLSGSTGDSLLYFTYLGGQGDESDPAGERGIKFNNCRIYLAITSQSSDFPLTTGAFDSVFDEQNTAFLPLIVSMANPPDLTNNTVTSGGKQTITCGASPAPITANVPSYIIPSIIRNGTSYPNGSPAAYPEGLPKISTYQWQYSPNGGLTWISIPGANAQNYTPQPIDSFTGTYLFRRTINGDYCSFTGDTLAEVTFTVTPPYPAPQLITNSPVCAGRELDLSTPTQSGYTYVWTGPDGFSSTAEDTTIQNTDSLNGGVYYLIVKNTKNGCPSYPDSAVVVVGMAGGIGYFLSTDTLCSGDSAILTIDSTSSNIQITPGSNVFRIDQYHYILYPDSSVSYLVTGASPCAAHDSLSFGLTVNPAGHLAYVLSDSLLCHGASATLHISTDSTVSITPFVNVLQQGDTLAIITPDSTTTYTLSIKGGTCSSSVSEHFTLAVDTITQALVSYSPLQLCPNDTAVICVSPGFISYMWNTGATTACVNTTSAGNFAVTATDNYSCSFASNAVQVVYQQIGTFSASLGLPSICFGDSAQVLVTDTNVSFFPAGSVTWTSGTTGFITPDTTSSYLIIAPVTCAVDTVNLSLMVDHPAVQLTASNNAICNDTAVTICATPGFVSYAWDSGGSSACIITAVSGSYGVIATDPSGCPAQSTIIVLVSVPAPGVFNYTPVDTSICPGNQVPFNFSGQLQVSFSPSSSVTFIDAAHALFSPDSSTVYTVIAEIACLPNDTLLLPVNLFVIDSVSVTADSTIICPNDSVQLCATGNNLNYNWNTGSTTSCIYASEAGTYFVSVTESNSCTAISSLISLTATTIAPFNHSTPPDSLCYGSSAVLSYTGGGDVQLFPAQAASRIDASSFSLHPDTTTLYTLIAVRNCNATDTVQFTIPVFHTSINLSSSDTINNICFNDSVQICANPGDVSYVWNDGQQGVCIYVSGAGNYYVTGTDSNNCVAVSGNLTVIEKPLPSISVSISGDTFTVFGHAVLQWYNNGAAISGANDTFYIAQGPGNYQVEVLDSNGCSSISNVFYFGTDVQQLGADAVTVYPNPLASGAWNLEVSMGFIGQTAEIYDDNGRLVYSTQIHSQHTEIIPSFARGIYMLRINSPRSTFAKKLVKM